MMGREFTLTGERSKAPISGLQLFANLCDGVLPHRWLCKVKQRLHFFSFLSCVYFAFSFTIKACFTACCFTGMFILPTLRSSWKLDELQA